MTVPQPDAVPRGCRSERASPTAARFAGLYASQGGAVVRAALVAPAGAVPIESVEARAGAVPTIVDLAPAAAWDEREAHDLHGLRFVGHEPLRPLLSHDAPLDDWTVPVAAGRLSGRGRPGPRGRDRVRPLSLPCGRRPHPPTRRAPLLQAPRAGAGRRRPPARRRAATPARLRGVCGREHPCLCTGVRGRPRPRADPDLRAHARSCSSSSASTTTLTTSRPSAPASASRRARTLRRAQGTRAPTQRAPDRASLPVRHGRLGASSLELTPTTVADARAELRDARRDATVAGATSSSSPRCRIGSRTSACSDPTTLNGSARRPRGTRRRRSRRRPRAQPSPVVRRTSSPAPPTGQRGRRAAARAAHARARQSLDLLDELLTGPSGRPRPRRPPRRRRARTGSSRAPRGATLCIVERDGDRLHALHLRTGSYANWPVVAHAAAGNLLPDFPLINKSFELCYACVDR